MEKVRQLLNGLAGYQSKKFEEDNVEIWEIPYFKLKVIWNSKEFNLFYEDNSTSSKISRIIHNFKDNKIELSLIELYDMFKEASEGLQNSQLISAGMNYTDQDIRNSKVIGSMLMNKVDTLMDILYENELVDADVSELNPDEIYLLIKIDENGYNIEGFTLDPMKVRRYASQSSFKKEYNKEEYPKYVYQVIKKYE